MAHICACVQVSALTYWCICVGLYLDHVHAVCVYCAYLDHVLAYIMYALQTSTLC